MRRFPLLLCAALLPLTGCQLTLLSFAAPATTPTSQLFEVSATFNATTVPGAGGGVLQVPNGFTVVSLLPSSSGFVRDDPTLLATYTAEPGHYLASWSASQQQAIGTVTYRVVLQAPATATTATFKVALAGQPLSQPWQSTSPAGLTNFAQITQATHVRTVAVVSVPSTDFALDAIGLPFGTVTSQFWAATLRDWDGDGNDDLATPYRAFHRQGSGWNEVSTGLVVSTLTNMRVAAGDFDGDGFVDLVQGGGRVYWGNGGTAWTPGPQLPTPMSTLAVATGDVNGDGRDDIALGGYYVKHLRVFLGNANRTFTAASTGLPTLPSGNGLEVLLRDVTGDGLLDLVADEVWAGNGLGAWTASTGITSSNGAWGVDAGDLDGDGLPEVVHANQSAGVAVWRHLGGNAWTLLATIAPSGRTVSSVAVIDYDRDGRNDLAIGYYDTTNGVGIWRNQGGMVFTPMVSTGLPASSTTYVNDLAVGDVNGDSFPDLAVAYFGEGVAVYQNWRGGLSAFGAGCGGASAPTIVGTSAPLLGNAAFAVGVNGGQPATVGLLWFGTSRRTWSGVPLLPLDLDAIGAPGCTLWVGPEALAAGTFDAAGGLQVGLPIPANPALLRQTFFAQGAASAPTANPLQLLFSGGLAFRVE